MRQEDIEQAPVREHFTAVNEAIAGKTDEPVLLHWNGSDEAIGHYMHLPGFKRKQWFEGWHIAFGTLTGGQLAEDWRGPHWHWQLPVNEPLHELLIWPTVWRWQEVRGDSTSIVGDSGAYPSLEEAEPLPTDELGSGPLGPRRARVVVGQRNILPWLKTNRHTAQHADEIFARIIQHTKQKQAA